MDDKNTVLVPCSLAHVGKTVAFNEYVVGAQTIIGKIAMIKRVRELTGMSLTESKTFVDKLVVTHHSLAIAVPIRPEVKGVVVEKGELDRAFEALASAQSKLDMIVELAQLPDPDLQTIYRLAYRGPLNRIFTFLNKLER